MAEEQKLRRQEPIDLLKQMDDTVAESMVGEMGSSPQTNFWGELKEGQQVGVNVLRPVEQKYLDHYNSEYGKHEAQLYGAYPSDRELMFTFLNYSGAYGEEKNKLKNGNYFEMPYRDKLLAKKMVEFENKIGEKLTTAEKKIRFDSKQKAPSQLDKYPKNLLTKEETKELNNLVSQVKNSEVYREMEDDQSKYYNNLDRLKRQKRLRKEGTTIKKPAEEYQSLYGFDPQRDYHIQGKNPENYKGEVPSRFDLPKKSAKWFYSQDQKPSVPIMDRLMHKLRGADEAIIE